MTLLVPCRCGRLQGQVVPARLSSGLRALGGTNARCHHPGDGRRSCQAAAAQRETTWGFEDSFEDDDVAVAPAQSIEVEAAALTDESLKIVNCNLSPETVKALADRGIAALFPIQKSVFDPAMARRDLLVRARTGSGKTLAFSLPIIEALLAENREDRSPDAKGVFGGNARQPRALILAPTRELAKQVAGEFESATAGTRGAIRVLTVYGGTPIGAQLREAARGIDVLVGTPGRVLDLVFKRAAISFDSIRFVVLDEADEMLNMGFQQDVERALEGIPAARQTMMFSATMPHWVRKLASRYSRQHIVIDLVGERDTGRLCEDIRALGCMTPTGLHEKRLLLADLITVHSGAGKTIVFCNTKRECETVVTGLSAIMPAEALHGDIEQDMREFTMARFREGKTHVLVATDVAARGLDVQDVDLVVHWDVPQNGETFLHRSGRTGRAGSKGTTIVLFANRNKGDLASVLRATRSEIELITAPSPQDLITAATKNIEVNMSRTVREVAARFEPTARSVLERGINGAETPAEILALAMATMAGFEKLPVERSILGQSEGFVTMGILTPGKRGFPSPGAVLGSLRRITSESVAGAVGKVELFDDPEDTGFEAAFDVPVQYVEQITMAASEHGAKVEVLKSLPMDLKQLQGGKFGGKNSGRDRFGGGGGGRQYGRNSGGGRSWNRGGGGGGGGGGDRSRGQRRGGSQYDRNSQQKGGYSRSGGGGRVELDTRGGSRGGINRSGRFESW